MASEALRDKPRKSRHEKLPIEAIFKRATGREMNKSERLVFHISLRKKSQRKAKSAAA
jgi:hypothetical protein